MHTCEWSACRGIQRYIAELVELKGKLFESANMTDIPMVDSFDVQLQLWVNGTSVHVKSNRFPGENYQCCPDFSCCHPELLQPEAVRREFAAASEDKQNRMLLVFLRALIAKETTPGSACVIG